MMHQSIATIDSPEFINLKPLELNPLMSSCEIKVLYLGENRNHSYITKEVATEMAKTLRGAPIVGYYREDKEDFRDHGEKIIFDEDGIKFECLTKPYGFVSPDAKVWFQKFEDTDDFGNNVVREYLMTTGYLWTGQFEESKLAIEEGRPQSMELDDKTLDGRWSTNNNTGIDFFIINDAIFSKLCILGKDVEPCFEGSSITAPEVSTSFTKIDNDFKKTLYTMMQDLRNVLEGGQEMIVEENNTEIENNTISTENESELETIEEVQSDVQENGTAAVTTENESETSEEEEEENTDIEEVVEQNYSALEEEFKSLQNQYTELEEKYKELLSFKENIDNEKKDELIKKFYMLSDEDKKDVIENKSKYSLDEIESKLSVICFRKKVSFDLEDSEKNENNTEVVSTYSLNDDSDIDNTPEWLKALKNTKNRDNNEE